MTVLELISAAAILAGFLFYLAGTMGMLRFPDVFTRLHALTKADNAGLGLVVLGLSLQAGSLREVFEFLLVWLLVLLSSTTAAHLIARLALEQGLHPWEEPS